MRDSYQDSNSWLTQAVKRTSLARLIAELTSQMFPLALSSRPVSLITANGPVKGNQSVKLDVPEINSILEMLRPGVNPSRMFGWKALHG